MGSGIQAIGKTNELLSVMNMCIVEMPSMKIIKFSEAALAANFDITPTSNQVQTFTGHVYGVYQLIGQFKKLPY